MLNLAYYAQTAGQVYFELTDELGQTAMLQQLGEGQTYAQFSTGGLGSGLYYWRLHDSARTIKTGKVVIVQ